MIYLHTLLLTNAYITQHSTAHSEVAVAVPYDSPPSQTPSYRVFTTQLSLQHPVMSPNEHEPVKIPCPCSFLFKPNDYAKLLWKKWPFNSKKLGIDKTKDVHWHAQF